MAEFKVGDKVTPREHSYAPGDTPVVGQVYEVVDLEPLYNWPILKGMDSGYSWGPSYAYSRFHLVKPEKPKRKVYIAGPITGIADDNFPAFNAAAEALKAAGLDVFNPADHGSGGDWAGYMKQDIPELLKCDLVVALPGYLDSKGARLELHIADQLGIPVILFFDVQPLLAAISA